MGERALLVFNMEEAQTRVVPLHYSIKCACIAIISKRAAGG